MGQQGRELIGERAAELVGHTATGAVKTHSRGDRPDSKSKRGLTKRQLINRDQLKHRSLTLGQAIHRAVEPAGLLLSCNPIIDASHVIEVQKLTAPDPRVSSTLATGTTPPRSDDQLCDPKQPRHRRAATRVISVRGLDRGHKHVRRQVCRNILVPHPPSNKPLNRIDMLAIERLKGLRIAPKAPSATVRIA
jgi:hypothetical protein